MEKLHQAAQQAVKQIEQQQQSSEVSSSDKPSLPMKSDKNGKARVAESLKILYNGLKVYGKEPEQLEDTTKLFMFALADYPVDKIVDGIAYYVRNYPEFPAPADIVQIIDRGNKPPFEKAVYVNVCKKIPEERTSAEWQYKRDYEAFMLKG